MDRDGEYENVEQSEKQQVDVNFRSTTGQQSRGASRDGGRRQQPGIHEENSEEEEEDEPEEEEENDEEEEEDEDAEPEAEVDTEVYFCDFFLNSVVKFSGKSFLLILFFFF